MFWLRNKNKIFQKRTLIYRPIFIPWADPKGGGAGCQDPLENHVAIGFLKTSGTDPLEKHLDPRVQSTVYRGRSLRPSLKYADD